MATTIKLKNGSGAPLAGDLVAGEPALDLTNKRLYTEDSGGTVIEIGTNPSTIDINAGTIDGTVIGGSSAAAGTFTTFTSTGIDDNATSTAITIDSSQNVGIGTVTLPEKLNINGNVFLNNASGDVGIKLGPTGNEAYIGYVGASGNLEITPRSGYNTVFNTGGTERMRITSGGNVGIGTTSPSTVFGNDGLLQVYHNTTDGIISTFGSTDSSNGAKIQLFQAGTQTWNIGMDAADPDLIFEAGTTEYMRIDSSGNLLVGKTAADDSTVGARFSNAGFMSLVRDGGRPLFIRRDTSDGDLVEFSRSGTTVGSLSAHGGAVNIGNGIASLAFLPSLNTIHPNGTGSGSDGLTTLGWSNNRFKDLYLSGGAYLGGTGAANHLDDYEEGTWSPGMESDGQVGSWNYGSISGYYTKIGRVVHAHGYMSWSGTPSTGAAWRIAGLPFAYLDANAGAVSIGPYSGIPNTNGLVGILTTTGGLSKTAISFYTGGSNLVVVTTGNNLSSSGSIYFTVTYIV